jgi:hypothetical protein
MRDNERGRTTEGSGWTIGSTNVCEQLPCANCRRTLYMDAPSYIIHHVADFWRIICEQCASRLCPDVFGRCLRKNRDEFRRTLYPARL